jgi:prophage DNA circulation protein
MTGFLDLFDEYPGAFMEASFGGVPFYMVDSRHPPGRRVQKLLFPGQDVAAFQDLGQDDGEIHISGLMIGDDFVAQAAALETVFQTAGPSTLDHPWLGNFLAVLMSQEIVFSHDELRCVRFTASVARFYPRVPPPADTEASLLTQLQNMRQAAFGMLDAVLGQISQVLSVISYAHNFAASVAGFFGLALLDVTGASSELLGALVLPQIALLTDADDLPPGVGFTAALGAALAAPSAAAVVAAQPPIPAAVAPGAPTTAAVAADAAQTTSFLLAVVTAVGAHAIDPAPGPALTLVTQALVLADAITAASDIVFTSQQDAATWLAELLAAVQACAQSALSLGASYPTLAANVWRGCIAAQSALSIDMNARIGRLPAIVTLTLPRPTPVWLIAQYLAGDTPGQVAGMYYDLVARNYIADPSLASGLIEALQATGQASVPLLP